MTRFGRKKRCGYETLHSTDQARFPARPLSCQAPLQRDFHLSADSYAYNVNSVNCNDGKKFRPKKEI